ncbi:MAG: CvpA family protein [Clostridia bacterium]|nr:CvpA family protein [Clostridia bacterium]
MADILIILIMAICCIWGLKKGFIAALYSFVSIFLSIFLVYLLKDVFVDVIAHSPIGDYIGGLLAKNYSAAVAENCSEAVVSIVAVVALYFLVGFILRIFGGLLNALAKLPIINTINKVAGAITGFLVGAVWVVIVVNVLYYIPRFNDFVSASFIADVFGIII